MSSTAHLWITKSNTLRTTLTGVFLLVAGVALIGFTWNELPDRIGAFSLGALLTVAGAGSLLFASQQTITVDTSKQRIRIERRNRFRRKVIDIPFGEIIEVRVDEMGDNEGGRARHYVELRLQNRKKANLFLGFFDGAHDRAAMEARADRLRETIKR